MLATATATLPSGAGWAYEFKWDGVRALIDVTEHGVRLSSRAGNDIGGGYPELLAQATGIGDALLDGEIVAFVDGRPSFGLLQTRMHLRDRRDVVRAAASAPVTFVAFDLVRRYGVDLSGRPYVERRATLERVLDENAGWTLSPSFDDGPATESVARANGLEGVVAKRLDSTYRSGHRTRDWQKLRFVRSGDFVVIGWEAAAEHPGTLSSLVLAASDDDGLRFAGKVGSGLSGRVAASLKRSLTGRADPAVSDPPAPTGGRRAYWVEPDTVVEVEFTDWTGDGRLRQPVFHGVRPDKRPDQADATGRGSADG